MQKKLIALAIAGLAAVPAFAQSNVTIYGRIDYGFLNRGQNDGGVQNVYNRAEFGSGLQAGSRIGFKGAEDLGNGLKAIFQTEFGIGIDQPQAGTTNAGWTNRNSYVGLTGGFGTVVGGRLDGVRYGIFNTYDPFAGGTVGNFTQMTPQVDRADNAVAYISPSFGGFVLTAAYSSNIAGGEGTRAGSVGGNDKDLRLNTIMLGYDNGPISAKLDYEQITTRGFNDDNRLWVATAGASYNFGVAKVSALYDIVKSDPNGLLGDYEARNWLVGVRAPIGKFTVKANYGRTNTEGVTTGAAAATVRTTFAAGTAVGTAVEADATKWAIGVDYALSKRTNLYADYGRINNKNNANFNITPSANSNAGYGVQGFDVGIAHTF